MPKAWLSARDVGALTLGCDLLGSGGGGSAGIATPLLAQHLAGDTRVRIVGEPDPDTRVAVIGAYGAATVMLESLPTKRVFGTAPRGLAQRTGPIEALLPLEVGGVNGPLAALVAATTGLPLIDADPMGRAFSAISDTVLGRGLALTSVFFATPGGHLVHIEADGAAEIERVLRSLLPSVGGWGAVAGYAVTAGEIMPHLVRGSLGRALSLGAALQAATAGRPEALLAAPGVSLVADGQVREVRREPGVEVRGVASIVEYDALGRRRPIRLDIANEYLAVIVLGELVASAPDIVCVLDAGWHPVPAEELRAGQRVRVLWVRAAAELAAAHARALARNQDGFGLASRGYHPVGV